MIWNTVGVIIYTVCALAGRSNLSEIFTNFLALMGYWVAIWFAIVLEEFLFFRFKSGYNWAAWRDPKKLPIGFAAFTAFVVGWVGAILCMAQVWYIGPIAKLVGAYGADVSFSFRLWSVSLLTCARWVTMLVLLGLCLFIHLCGTLSFALWAGEDCLS